MVPQEQNEDRIPITDEAEQKRVLQITIQRSEVRLGENDDGLRQARNKS